MQFIQSLPSSVLDDSIPVWKRAAALGGAAVILATTANGVYQYVQTKKMDAVRENYQQELKEKTLAFQQYLQSNPMTSEEIEEITHLPGMVLLEKLRSKSLDYRRVLLAYQHKAFQVNLRLNCVTEFLIPDLSEIRLDGPLAGIPISVKEHFALKGLVTCTGCTQLISAPRPTEDMPLIRVIKDLGGIPFCRTNIPQTMMSFNSANPVYGVTVSPFDNTRSPGGSSSGEGALIGAGGSPLGLGTDIGGSVRVPSAFCGIVGMKPTAGRFSEKGLIHLGFQNLIHGTWGPMSRDISLAEELLRLISESRVHRSLDYSLPPVQWNLNMENPNRKLRIGYFTFDGFFHASPAMVNVVMEVKAALEAAGHELIPFKMPGDPKERFLLYFRSMSSDGGYFFREGLQYDRVDPTLNSNITLVTYSPLRHGKLAIMMNYILGNRDAALYLTACQAIPAVWRLWKHAKEVEMFKARVEEVWRSHELDALICPAFGTIQPFIKEFKACTGAAMYTAVFNLLNYPAGMVPVRTIQKRDLEAFESGEYPENSSMWHKNVARYHENSIGLPVAVQVVAPIWQDEMCFHVMKQVQQAIEQLPK